jgi:large subunit ribosomal protein L21
MDKTINSNSYAIVETAGKQYIVSVDDKIRINKHISSEEYVIDKVLLIKKDDNVVIGTPYIENAKVIASVERKGKGKKIIVFKYRAKKGYRRKYGHRQPYTDLLIKEIILP